MVEKLSMFLAKRPAPDTIQDFLAASRHLPLSYEPIGLARNGATGFRTDELRTTVGQGPAAFARAKQALATWRHFQLGWLELFPAGVGTETGTVVAVLIRHLGFWSINGCRVVYTIDRDGELGFAYGTLTNHAESGEEIFTVSMDSATGDVSYTIRAVSRPRVALARLGTPVTRALQARFRRDSSAAMARACAD